MKFLKNIILILFCLCSFSEFSGAKEPKKPLAMNASYLVQNCPVDTSCMLEMGTEVFWNFNRVVLWDCEDIKIKEPILYTYEINVFVKNQNKYPIKIQLTKFNVYAFKNKIKIQGTGELSIEYNLKPETKINFSYDERCFSSKLSSGQYVTSLPELADFEITIFQ